MQLSRMLRVLVSHAMTSETKPVSSLTNPTVRIGLLGYGTVGSSLARLLIERREALLEASGVNFELTKVAVRNPDKYDFDGPFTVSSSAEDVVTDPDVDLVVELIGGIEPARELILMALGAGKPVVTGNKELIANHGLDLAKIANLNQVDLLFEASTAGAIPILRPLRESLLGEEVQQIVGIVNGTTNYILSQMSETGAAFDDALAEAQRLGYAEADPTADVEGHDAAAKAAIMSSIAFGGHIQEADVACEGITSVTAADTETAKSLGYVIKLLAVCSSDSPDRISARVAPTLVPVGHPLAAVRGSYNAVFVRGSASSELMFYGRGAGGRPTASAVLGDIVDASRNLVQGTYRELPSPKLLGEQDPGVDQTSFFVVVEVDDTPGVLSEISGVFAKHQVSINRVEQTPIAQSDEQDAQQMARIVFTTQSASESAFANLFEELEDLTTVSKVVTKIRILDE